MLRIGKAKPESWTSGMLNRTVFCTASATSATAAEAVQKTVLFSIPLVQLSGFAFPIRSMPTPVRWLAELFPATHYIRVSRAIYLRGEGFLGLLPELALLALFTLILVAVALRSIEGRA